jgi:hypothetical protein
MTAQEVAFVSHMRKFWHLFGTDPPNYIDMHKDGHDTETGEEGGEWEGGEGGTQRGNNKRENSVRLLNFGRVKKVVRDSDEEGINTQVGYGDLGANSLTAKLAGLQDSGNVTSAADEEHKAISMTRHKWAAVGIAMAFFWIGAFILRHFQSIPASCEGVSLATGSPEKLFITAVVPPGMQSASIAGTG